MVRVRVRAGQVNWIFGAVSGAVFPNWSQKMTTAVYFSNAEKVRGSQLSTLNCYSVECCLGIRLGSASVCHNKTTSKLSLTSSKIWSLFRPMQIKLGYDWGREGETLHAPIHKGSDLGAGQRKLAGSSVITYRSWSQPDPQGNSINRITV